MIPVTGATGNAGGELVHALVARGRSVRAVVRNPAAAVFPDAVDVAAADLAAPGTMSAALAGIRQVFLLGGFATTELLRTLRSAVSSTSYC